MHMKNSFNKILGSIPRSISIVLGILSFIGICVLIVYYISSENSFYVQEIALLSSLLTVFLTSLYVMTTLDQTSSMVNQLNEMKLDRKTQQQPLLIPKVEKFIIDAPRLFFSPPTEEYKFATRCHADIIIENLSSIPVINVQVKSKLYTEKNDTRQVEWESCAAFDTIGNSKVTAKNMLLQVLHPNEFFNIIRSSSAPLLEVEVIYNNIMGAHFAVVKQFALYQSSNDNDSIINWHSDLVSFETKEKENIKHLYRLRQDGVDTEELFTNLKDKYKYQKNEICLSAEYIPGHIDATLIDDDKYYELLKSFFFGRRLKNNSECLCRDSK